MLVGCYYRCPIALEHNDTLFPRFFVLGQVTEYNQLSDTVVVKMHDVLRSSAYYSALFQNNTFRAQDVVRCEAVPSGAALYDNAQVTIIAKAAEPNSTDEPYWYWIQTEHGKYKKVCETELQIEYSQMNHSPHEQLKNYEFQHPTWFTSRLNVSRNLHLVNNSIYGFNVLVGCRAYMMPHQISTVARCFEAMPIRYMLADEVGLGKTIEACSILSILAQENRKLRALIIVPAALISQWKSELHFKFGIEAQVNSIQTGVSLLAMEDICNGQIVLQVPWDIAIIDETHRLLKNDLWYDKVQNLSRRTTHILLLSATPIQDRNEEYRRLLALLTPEQYQDMSMDQFKGLVQKQKRIQKTVNQQLKRLYLYDDYCEIINDQLQEIAENLQDKALFRIVASINLQDEDRGLEKVRQALSYICENYRLERKVIRNRRQIISERMASRKLVSLSYTPLTQNENYNESGAIQSLLNHLTDSSEDDLSFVKETAIVLLGALFSSPWAFEQKLRELHITDNALLEATEDWKRQACSEHALAAFALDEDPSYIKGRLMHAMNYIDQETDILTDESFKLVVFTGYNATLSEFLSLFNRYYENKGIYAVAFGQGMDRKLLEDSVYAFQNDPACRVIVCDETGGEGRNFQNARQVIHLDLPWTANSLEQRIGRLDRLGRDREMDVVSVVFYAENTVEEQLFHIWRDALKIFNHSLSGLEIITGELNERIAEALLDDYFNGLEDAFDDILDEADEMRESVEDEQDFDLGATLYRPMMRGVNSVLKQYSENENHLFAKAMLSWGHQAGLSALHPSPGLLCFSSERFSVNAARQSLLIPPDWSKYQNASILRHTGKILGSFDRATASQREDILFFAPGDAVYDSIITNAIGCSRGRCAAMEIRGDFDYHGLIYVFTTSQQVDELLEKGFGLQTLSQYKMYLPLEQIIIPIGLTSTSREIPEQDVIHAVSHIDINHVRHLGKRGGVHSGLAPLEQFMMRFPQSTWEPLVNQCTARAYKKAALILKEESDLTAAKSEMQRVLLGHRAESIYFERDDDTLRTKQEVFSASLKALASTKPVLDAVCYLRIRKYEQQSNL